MAKNKSQYDSTLNLPKTLFEMRAGLPKKEPVMLKDWDDNDLYNQLMKHNEGKPQFILHDGPPYANGNIHMGTALNKICLLYTSPSPRDRTRSRMPSSA